MRRSFLAATFVLATAAAALVTTSSAAAPSDGVPRAQWTGMIMGLSGSKIHGEATVRPGKEPGTTEITLTYTGDAAATTRPWHLHIGSCANGTGVFGGTQAYTPLVSDAKGGGKTTVTIPLAMPMSGDYSINFHESPTRMATYVACGDLKFAK
ncbi:MAG: hypothetical protein IT353_23115 [Gemmatimonadaceae bacterium]|nr:hypothetical protein [Gemmatimonadaceae bacterium]